MRRGIRSAVPAVLALGLLAAGCSTGGGTPDPGADGTTAASSPATGAAGSTASSPSASASPTGTAEDPTRAQPGTALLDWQSVPGPTGATVTRSGEWSLGVNDSGTEARLTGPGSDRIITSDSRERISDGLIDGRWAVVVLQDRQESRASTARILDLDHPARSFSIDGSAEVPTTSGGTWALGEGRLLHATVHKGSYCVASVTLTTQKPALGWCAPKRHGFNGARITPAGQTLLTFDDARPACRTAVRLLGAEVEPLADLDQCAAWDSLVVPGGAVWSVLPNEKRVEGAHFYARQGRSFFDLGPGTSGTLTWCDGAAYFVRDPQRDGDPASLMRWRGSAGPGGLDTVYESPRGQAFLTTPRCGGTTITVTALAEAGDEQVSADLGQG